MAVGGQSYKLLDWIIALADTGGVTEFLMTSPISSRSDAQDSSYGLLLFLGFLMSDGFTSTFQETLYSTSCLELPAAWCWFHGVGIICTLVVYGLLQEHIISSPTPLLYAWLLAEAEGWEINAPMRKSWPECLRAQRNPTPLPSTPRASLVCISPSLPVVAA